MREKIKKALLQGKVRTFDGKVVPVRLLTDNPFIECSLLSQLVKDYECGEIYIDD